MTLRVPAEQTARSRKEKSDAEVDWQFVNYGGACNSFTDQRPQSRGRNEYEPAVAAALFPPPCSCLFAENHGVSNGHPASTGRVLKGALICLFTSGSTRT